MILWGLRMMVVAGLRMVHSGISRRNGKMSLAIEGS